MGRRCEICGHPEREAIERRLLAGDPPTAAAAGFGVSRHSAQRHRDQHMKPAVEAETEMPRSHEELVAQARELQAKTLTALERAEDEGDTKVVLRAMREARQNLQVLAKLLTEIDHTPQVNVLMLPQWWRVRSCILEVLEPYPEVRFVLSERLVALGEVGESRSVSRSATS
jgi:hypothetical protein